MIERVILIVLDSVGVGELPDAARYGDQGSNTLGHVAEAVGGLSLPNLASLGLGKIIPILGLSQEGQALGAYGKMGERSSGKDTTTGHWEMAGVILDHPFPTYPQGFPPEIIEAFQSRIGKPVLGNKVASGTAIIEELGPRHLETGWPIVYTSADSVFQIAAHEEVIPIEELYAMCQAARELLVGEHAVGRVIARPFLGSPGSFRRTPRRHDYALKPPQKTMLDHIQEAGLAVAGVGKIGDIFAQQGVTKTVSAKSNMEGVDRVLELMAQVPRGLIMANLVDFDSLYGHRNDPVGYAQALTDFDGRLPEIMGALKSQDVLILTADHGCDPTTVSTDHSREYVPVLVTGPKVNRDVDLGIRNTFADLGATIVELLGVKKLTAGESMVTLLLK